MITDNLNHILKPDFQKAAFKISADEPTEASEACKTGNNEGFSDFSFNANGANNSATTSSDNLAADVKLLAPIAALENALKLPQAIAAIKAELKAYAYAKDFALKSAEFAQIAQIKAPFSSLFAPLVINPEAASCEQDAAVLVLACELEAVAGLKKSCESEALEPEIKDLFFRIWATSVSEIQPILGRILAPTNSGGVDELVNKFIKDILNKE